MILILLKVFFLINANFHCVKSNEQHFHEIIAYKTDQINNEVNTKFAIDKKLSVNVTIVTETKKDDLFKYFKTTSVEQWELSNQTPATMTQDVKHIETFENIVRMSSQKQLLNTVSITDGTIETIFSDSIIKGTIEDGIDLLVVSLTSKIESSITIKEESQISQETENVSTESLTTIDEKEIKKSKTIQISQNIEVPPNTNRLLVNAMIMKAENLKMDYIISFMFTGYQYDLENQLDPIKSEDIETLMRIKGYSFTKCLSTKYTTYCLVPLSVSVDLGLRTYFTATPL
ncbi:uncharacterized protein LOC128956903 [Oppia nitens]|uniref:uncharacterized protein LOC128956903 n=1 Tax=Oppia nitens TaxID=1686743 RepID=UPI0023DC6A0A|nr:uncharacterized protein LOC128956903 [Oppia nitens]